LLTIGPNAKLGSFRILPKLHKNKFGIRPIINCKDHPTSNLAFLMDVILQPFVKNSESYIQDSQNLIQKIGNQKFPIGSRLFSCDFESLYINIDHVDAHFVICFFMKDKLNSKHINIQAFSKILELILNHNIFLFDCSFFRQVIGIAMGSKCGPSIANVYLSCYEKKWLVVHRPLFYARFIDDVLVISLNSVESLNTAFLNLRINITEGSSVVFLDLKISFDRLLRQISFSLYIKPTNTFCFLFILSNHPLFIFNNIPKSIFIRVRRICSSFIDYLFYSRLFTFELIKRGYSFKLLSSQSRMIGKIDRNDLIPYKNKKKFIDNKTIFLNVEFEKTLVNLKDIFIKTWKNTFLNHETLKDTKLIILNKMQLNLSSLMVHNFPYPKISIFSYKNCSDLNCFVCRFAINDSKICLNSNFYLPIENNSSCETIDCVYILCCTKCSYYYIGQTNCFKRRFNEHVNKIINFVPFVTRDSNVALHFNLAKHDYSQDLKFYIYKSDMELSDRLKQETFLIHLFMNLDVKVLNELIPSIKNVLFSNYV
jgi:hypothetical protein